MILGEKCIRLQKCVGYHGVKAVFCLKCFLARTLNLVAHHVQETGRHTHLRRIFFFLPAVIGTITTVFTFKLGFVKFQAVPTSTPAPK